MARASSRKLTLLPVLIVLVTVADVRCFPVPYLHSTTTLPTSLNNNSELVYRRPNGANGGIKRQQISASNGHAATGNATHKYMFSVGPLLGSADITNRLPATQFRDGLNVLYAVRRSSSALQPTAECC